MTVESNPTEKRVHGDGTAPTISFTFRLLQDSDLTVYLVTLADGTLTLQTKDTDYTIDREEDGQGGTITMLDTVSAAYDILLLPNVEIIQSADLVPEGSFNESSVEDALDRAILVAQQLQRLIDRCVKFPLSDSSPTTELSSSALRANKVLAFDGDGDLIFLNNSDAGTADPLNFGNTSDPSLGDALLGVKQPFPSAGARTQHEKNQDVVTVADWLIKGDGSDESALLALAMEESDGKVLDLLGLTVTCNSDVTYDTVNYLKNGALHFPNVGNGLKPSGTLGVASSPAGPLTKGNKILTYLVAPGYAVDDLLFITSTDAWGASGEITTQWAKVKTVSGDGLTVTLRTPFDYTFTTAIAVYRPDLVESATLDNIKITGIGADNAQDLFNPTYVKKVTLINCDLSESGHSCVTFTTCYDVAWWNLRLAGAMAAGTGYGVCFEGGCEFIRGYGTIGEDMRHVIMGGGLPESTAMRASSARRV
jgi:hypothetical protein